MNNQLPALLHCPNCREKKDYVNLGSVSSEGYLIVKRQFGKFTMVMAETFSIICQCGYYIRIDHGKITARALTPSMNG